MGKTVNVTNVRKASSLESLDELNLSKRTRGYIDSNFGSYEIAVNDIRKMHLETNCDAKWFCEAVAALDAAGFIRHDTDCLRIYQCVLKLYQDIMDGLEKDPPECVYVLEFNEFYESCRGISDAKMQELMVFLGQNLKRKHEVEVIKLAYGLVDGKPKHFTDIADMLGVTPGRIREVYYRAYRVLRRLRTKLPDVLDAPETIMTAEEIIEELRNLYKSPEFMKEVGLINKLRRIQLSDYSVIGKKKELFLDGLGMETIWVDELPLSVKTKWTLNDHFISRLSDLRNEYLPEFFSEEVQNEIDELFSGNDQLNARTQRCVLLEDMGLNARAYKALSRSRFKFSDDIYYERDSLKGLCGLGAKSLDEIVIKMRELGYEDFDLP